MASHTTHPPMTVRNENDVITLRQEVRKFARLQGLALTQQAKMTTVISTMARAALMHIPDAQFSMQTIDQASRQALEIRCRSASARDATAAAKLKYVLLQEDIHTLVDEATFEQDSRGAAVVLRMWR